MQGPRQIVRVRVLSIAVSKGGLTQHLLQKLNRGRGRATTVSDMVSSQVHGMDQESSFDSKLRWLAW